MWRFRGYRHTNNLPVAKMGVIRKLFHKVEFPFTRSSFRAAFIFLSSTDLDEAIHAFVAFHCKFSVPAAV